MQNWACSTHTPHTQQCTLHKAQEIHPGDLRNRSCRKFAEMAPGAVSLTTASLPSGPEMNEGTFYAVVYKQPALSFLLPNKSKHERLIEQALKPVHTKWDAEAVRNPRYEPFSASQAVPARSRAQKFVFGSTAGLTIRPGSSQSGSPVVSPQPYWHQAKSHSVVFCGNLANLQELAADVSGESRRSFPGAWGDDDEDTPGAIDGCAQLTTTTLLKLYEKLGPGRELLFLSELQGHYAFMILDAHKKLVFAARDPTGEEELYYSLSDDGAISFTNSLVDLPPDVVSAHTWREVPPGHYVSGKDHALSQFALTPEQLAERERHESGESLDDTPLWGEGSWEADHSHSGTPPTPSLLRRFSKPWS